MRVKMKARDSLTGLLMMGCRIKIFRRERDLLIFMDGMRDSFKIDAGMRDEKQKTTTLQMLHGGTVTPFRRDRHLIKHSGIAGLTRT